jgi:hypothetical protein
LRRHSPPEAVEAHGLLVREARKPTAQEPRTRERLEHCMMRTQSLPLVWLQLREFYARKEAETPTKPCRQHLLLSVEQLLI